MGNRGSKTANSPTPSTSNSFGGNQSQPFPNQPGPSGPPPPQQPYYGSSTPNSPIYPQQPMVGGGGAPNPYISGGGAPMNPYMNPPPPNQYNQPPPGSGGGAGGYLMNQPPSSSLYNTPTSQPYRPMQPPPQPPYGGPPPAINNNNPNAQLKPIDGNKNPPKDYLYQTPSNYPYQRSLPGQTYQTTFQPITPYNQLSYTQTVYDDPRLYRGAAGPPPPPPPPPPPCAAAAAAAAGGKVPPPPPQDILFNKHDPFPLNSAPLPNCMGQPPLRTGQTFKLSYFDFDGRAEIIRMIFNTAGVPFEDFRFPPAEWPQIKPRTPIGQVPILETSESAQPLTQSLAIARYVAKLTGLAGRSSLEMAMVDAVVDTALELYQAQALKIAPLLKSSHSLYQDRNKIIQEFINTDVARTFTNLEKLMRLYGQNEYFVGTQLTWADLYVYQVITGVLNISSNALQFFPKLASNRRRIDEDPRIAPYLRTRKFYPPFV